MVTQIKKPSEISSMKIAGGMLASVLDYLKRSIESDMTTKYIADMAAKELKALGGKPTFLGYYGFPDVICISINDEIIHGIPSTHKTVRSGDIISLDFGVTYKGMVTDSATSFILGAGRSSDTLLLKKTKASLDAAVDILKPGIKVGDISSAIQKVLDSAGLGIVRDYVGHGVGHELHEEPNIPNYGTRGEGPILAENMTIAIEPMATLGSDKTVVDADGWTVRTKDGSRAAHFEHTILVTSDGGQILTQI